MRSKLRAVGLFFAVVVVLGCAEDRYKLRPKVNEEYIQPPDERRYNEPDKAGYRKPPAPAKEEKSAIGGRPGPGGSPSGL